MGCASETEIGQSPRAAREHYCQRPPAEPAIAMTSTLISTRPLRMRVQRESNDMWSTSPMAWVQPATGPHIRFGRRSESWSAHPEISPKEGDHPAPLGRTRREDSNLWPPPRRLPERAAEPQFRLFNPNQGFWRHPQTQRRRKYCQCCHTARSNWEKRSTYRETCSSMSRSAQASEWIAVHLTTRRRSGRSRAMSAAWIAAVHRLMLDSSTRSGRRVRSKWRTFVQPNLPSAPGVLDSVAMRLGRSEFGLQQLCQARRQPML